MYFQTPGQVIQQLVSFIRERSYYIEGILVTAEFWQTKFTLTQ